MDELIKTVSEKAGINAEQAKNAVASVVEFIKAKVPGVGEQIAALLAGGGGGIGGGAADVLGSLRGKLGL